MRANQTVVQIGALLLAVALLCGCGKKGRLYLPDEQETEAAARTGASAAPRPLHV